MGSDLAGHFRQRQVRRRLERRRASREWSRSTAVDGVRGLFFGDASQLWAQLLDAAVVAVFGFVMAYVWFKFSNLITPIRVSREVEMEGLDVPEMGAHGYPDFTVTSHSSLS